MEPRQFLRLEGFAALATALAVYAAWNGPLWLLVAAIWVGHVGADRLLGYGLKYATGFRDTHRSDAPAPLAALVGER